MIPIKHTFRLVSKSKIKKLKILKKINKQALLKKAAFTRDKKIEIEIEKDSNKRAFFKFAGLIGVGALASTLIPKKAEALVFGSTPAASHVGVKDSTNNPIDPATEGTLSNVNINATAIKTTAEAIKLNSDKFNFDGNNNLLVGTTMPGAENIGVAVNDQSIWMLRKIITLLKPLGMTTGAGSNRLSIDVNAGSVNIGSGTVNIGSGTVTTVSTVTSLTNLANIGNVNAFSLMKDSAKNAYANSIRNKITF